MSQSSHNARRRVPRRFALPVAVLAATACGVALGSWIASRVRRAESLVVEPPVADFADTAHPEGAPVRAMFRLVNPLDRSVVVKELATSCACTASLLEGGRSLPLTLEPGGAIALALEVRPVAQPPDLIQVVRAVVSAECAGRPLPPAAATVRVLVEDRVKPEPPEIRIGDAPTGKPVQRRIALTTVSPRTKVGLPHVRVSDPSVIRAKVVAGKPSGVFDDRLTIHSQIEVELVGNRKAEPIVGFVDLHVEGRDIRVPVECTFRRPYRLSSERMVIAGRPGEAVVKELFYEAREPGWEDPEVVAAPPGLKVAIRPFDAATRVLSIGAKVPESATSRDDQTITLRPKGRDDEITIRVHYDRRE